MITRRGANAAPDLANQQPVSEILRVQSRTAPASDARHERAEAQPFADEDDLYGNMPFTD
jgi:hypothetical protein